ncbi:hypothetical protein RRG08_027937 [Elysia crispata]|uniref:Uncharacterized protein n=1 Tax=Elysia crispata TaxID=231223 RepID=A0AAE0Y7P6_9GAST|nr:hypothetical protein RRG08_027937 [Elysia crispata]
MSSFCRRDTKTRVLCAGWNARMSKSRALLSSDGETDGLWRCWNPGTGHTGLAAIHSEINCVVGVFFCLSPLPHAKELCCLETGPRHASISTSDKNGRLESFPLLIRAEFFPVFTKCSGGT